jgi:hypothetical protein
MVPYNEKKNTTTQEIIFDLCGFDDPDALVTNITSAIRKNSILFATPTQ